MCDHSHSDRSVTRHGSCLEHGAAHTSDHARWSRRDFLASMGLAAAGGAVMLGGTPVKAYGNSSLLHALNRLETNRVLVLVRLSGGNDGLNTIVPFRDDEYRRLRPLLALRSSQTFHLTDDLGMHNALSPLNSHYAEGRMAVVQNVGYPVPNLSHFLSTDIWESASETSTLQRTGWLGRYLDEAFPDFAQDPPRTPVAVQVGGGSPLLFQGSTANMSMTLINAELFERIAATGQFYSMEGIPDTTYGQEMAFMRQTLNDSFLFADAIRQAVENVRINSSYPVTRLGEYLGIAAQLIKGGLGSRIYMVSIGGFDTHSDQRDRHGPLLDNVGRSIAAFLDDVNDDEVEEEVLVMTYSEFGRRIEQNGSGGTDHGSAAPLFLFGNGIQGGVYGHNPDLVNLDSTGNIAYEFDFRSVYASVLQDWFGLPAADVAGNLHGAYETLPVIKGAANPTAVEEEAVPEAFALHQNYPNPFNPTTAITYTLAHTARVQLRLYDVQGRLVRTLLDKTLPAGSYAQPFDATGLPSGTYLYRLETPDGHQSRQMTLIR